MAKIPQGGPDDSSASTGTDQTGAAQPEEAEAATESEDSTEPSSDPATLSAEDFTIGQSNDVAHDDAEDRDAPPPENPSGTADQETASESAPVDSLGQQQQNSRDTGGAADTSSAASVSTVSEPTASESRQSAQAPSYETEPSNEYWTPNEPPPPPEDEPPADLYETSDRRPGGPPEKAPEKAPAQSGGPRGQRPSFRERHAAEIAAARQRPAAPQAEDSSDTNEDENFSPSADDESIEDSSLYGRAAIERILGGLLIEERPHQAN